MEPELTKYVVTYSVGYKHVVKVGVNAGTPEDAILLVREALDIGTVWDNTPEIPLLYDEYVEADDPAIQLNAEAVGQFPDPDPSALRQVSIWESMVGELGSLQHMADFTREAMSATIVEEAGPGGHPCPSCGRSLGRLASCQSDDCPSYRDGTLWKVASENGCVPFEVNAPSFQDAIIEALNALGWSITPAS